MTYWKAIAICLVGLAVGGLGAVVPWLFGADATLISEAQAIVRGMLLDPESARFRSDFVMPTSSGTRIVCGEVNAKNRMGGYVGFILYTYQNDTVYLLKDATEHRIYRDQFALCGAPPPPEPGPPKLLR